ncbi:hypothetical protein KGD82_13800 [Nocardiopsis eucommiae]|uniref:FtsK domain-containing protein n=1 Tax=Nocardiopsis eucommiae TaxID=2831970 RepID=A0A975LC08_9ACTN|nr:hypothetical protein KGD82_13800 [Nocardiopsis eucommiae]
MADTLELYPLFGVGAALVGGITTFLVSGMDDRETLVVHEAQWAAAGGWMTWALWSSSPWWGPVGLVLLATGSVIGAALGPMAKRHAAAPAKESSGGLVVGSTSRRNLDWVNRLNRVCGIQGAQCDTVEWDNAAGYDVTVVLPEGGATRKDITAHTDALASDADLPDGCSIRVVASGKGRRTALLRVGTVNRLKETILYPKDKPWTSTLDPKTFGEAASGDLAQAHLRESSQLIVGPPGSGKTTQLQVLTAECAKTTDGLVWHLDLNGGGLSQPWVDAWIDGKVQRCPIDWPASTEDECVRALKAAIRIAKHRKTAYRKRKREANVSLLPIGADLPAISVILDEGAQATSNRKIVPLLEELQNIARDSAVILRLSALSPTGDMVPPPMRRNTGTRTAMYSPDEELYSFLSGWTAGRAMGNDDLAGKGTGFLVDQGGAPLPFRGYNITPAMIEEIAVDVARNRVELDLASRKAAGDDYATRWSRARVAFDPSMEDDSVDEELDSDDVMDALADELGDEDWTAGWGDPFGDDEDPRTTVREVPVTSTLPAAEEAPAVDTPVDDILVGALRVMADAGSDRATREQLAARLTGGDEELLRSRMKQAGCKPVHSLKVDGKDARGWYRRDIEEALAVTPA